MSKRYTIMIVPERSSRVKRIRVARSSLWIGGTLLVLLLVAVAASTVLFFKVRDRLAENRVLREENVELKTRLVALHEQMSSVRQTVDRALRYSAKLEVITGLHDPKRHLAMGPFESQTTDIPPDANGVVDPLVRAIGEQPHLALKLLGNNLERLAADARRSEEELRAREAFLRTQKVRLASTPSVWPARGWVTSGFGMRPDPYTGKPAMHSGLDIANQLGLPVVATAKGVVVSSGVTSEGYGRTVVIDHGFGIKTRFAHLSEAKVRVGDRVDRGDEIGKIGNSGRSTGPHLHYEVEVNGVCVDPSDFILEE
jgi:murein DD-endopeptidase MepM/ murein hydrolase activator NlpD